MAKAHVKLQNFAPLQRKLGTMAADAIRRELGLRFYMDTLPNM
jgi:hypothetical protein